MKMSQEKFMHSSIFLFLDLIVVAVNSWLFWLVITKLISSAEVGQSTSVYSLVVLSSTVVGLGLEYPLLKKASNKQSKIVGSSLLVEIIVTILAVPFMFFALNSVNHQNIAAIDLTALILLLSITVGFVTRYALLGISASKTILIIDTVSAAVKFIAGYLLVLMGFGALGVLLAFMIQAVVTACISLILTKKLFGFEVGNLETIKKTIKDAVVNMPSIFSRTLIVTLSVVLLAAFGVSSSEVGVFYIALMISLVAGGLISSTAYMVIPASSASQTDFSTGSIRIGISLTAPVISLLLAAPQFIMSLIGNAYISGYINLIILAVGILPFAIATNTISRFNYLGESRKLLFLGSLQIVGFITAFFFLVPQLSATGAAISIVFSYSISSIPALLWSERPLLRYVINAGVAILSGWLCSFILRTILTESLLTEIIAVMTSILVTFYVILALKNLSIIEVKSILKTVMRSAN
jgi:O-antigen/teichoic acid export membrane protein